MLLRVFCLFSLIYVISCQSTSNTPPEDVYKDFIHFSKNYLNQTLKEKMIESLSVSTCNIGGDVKIIKNPRTPIELTVLSVPPSDYLLEKWGDNSFYKKEMNVFSGITHNLCLSPDYEKIAKGYYSIPKGCYPKRFFANNPDREYNYMATLHPAHPRCDFHMSTILCLPEHEHDTFIAIPSKYRSLYTSFPFRIYGKNSVISRAGMLALPCGPFGVYSSCETGKYALPITNQYIKDTILCRKDITRCSFPVYNRVFILTQYDDTQIGQFIQENLPKLIYNLDYLYQNPDILIHFGYTKKDKIPPFVLPNFIFQTLGLSHRLINGTIFSKEFIIPREGGCQDIGYNSWETVYMRDYFLKTLGIQEDIHFNQPTRKPSIVIITRSPNQYTQNRAYHHKRAWHGNQVQTMKNLLHQLFPSHTVDIFSDKNSTLMENIFYQAEIFSRADIVIGYHGAGLSNAIFMKPGGYIFEYVYFYDSRHAPIIGIFPRLSSIIGLHHMTYYLKNVQLNITQACYDIFDYVQKTKAQERKQLPLS